MKIAVVIATRPDVIKMAPVIHALRRHKRVEVRVVLTSQHRELVAPLVKFFELPVHHDLNVMEPGQNLSHVTTAVLNRFEAVLMRDKPAIVLVQGDTSSAFAAGLAAFYHGIPVGHVEAGLRTYDIHHPFPEEANRRFLTTMATWHFAPTSMARAQLLAEKVEKTAVFMTGNTVVDALFFSLSKQARRIPALQRKYGLTSRPFVLLTCHRRENHGEPLRNICAAIRQVAERHPELDYVLPLHPNPMAGAKIRAMLNDLPSVKLLEPIHYPEFVVLLKCCLFVTTDSGGIQEEAPALGKPVLVLRERTERPEAIRAGVARLIGIERRVVASEMLRLIERPSFRKKMSRARSLFGDGRAAEKIVSILLKGGSSR